MSEPSMEEIPMTEAWPTPPTTTPIRVLVVDDDPLVVSGLCMLLDQVDDIAVVATASDGDEVIAAIDAHHPDVVLLDLRMKRQDGLTTTTQIHRLSRPPRVLVLTTWETDDVVARAITAGAAGFLLKTAPPKEILDGIRRVANGHGVLAPDKISFVLDLVNAGSGGRSAAGEALVSLTGRELEVATAVARDLSNAQIARELHLSETTVKTHLSSIQRKLGVPSRVGIAVTVARAGLLD
ncbi:response regulator [Calidifontibacter terrae]